MRVKATAFAEAAGGRGRGIAPVLWLAAVVGVIAALALLFGQIRDTVSMADPAVRAAQARASIAEADHRTAELQRETANLKAQNSAEAPWEPAMVGAQHIAVLGLLFAVPVGLLLALGAGALMVRRHLSLPTSDGRVPLVGLDQELSAEALFRYQALRGGGSSYEALPVGQPRRRPELDVLEAAQPEEDRVES
jgi:hypothetical protein